MEYASYINTVQKLAGKYNVCAKTNRQKHTEWDTQTYKPKTICVQLFYQETQKTQYFTTTGFTWALQEKPNAHLFLKII